MNGMAGMFILREVLTKIRDEPDWFALWCRCHLPKASFTERCLLESAKRPSISIVNTEYMTSYVMVVEVPMYIPVDLEHFQGKSDQYVVPIETVVLGKDHKVIALTEESVKALTVLISALNNALITVQFDIQKQCLFPVTDDLVKGLEPKWLSWLFGTGYRDTAITFPGIGSGSFGMMFSGTITKKKGTWFKGHQYRVNLCFNPSWFVEGPLKKVIFADLPTSYIFTVETGNRSAYDWIMRRKIQMAVSELFTDYAGRLLKNAEWII